MFQSTLTGKVVTFREYLMIAFEPSSYGGETREPKSWKISHTKFEKKIKKGKKQNLKIKQWIVYKSNTIPLTNS